LSRRHIRLLPEGTSYSVWWIRWQNIIETFARLVYSVLCTPQSSRHSTVSCQSTVHSAVPRWWILLSACHAGSPAQPSPPPVPGSSQQAEDHATRCPWCTGRNSELVNRCSDAGGQPFNSKQFQDGRHNVPAGQDRDRATRPQRSAGDFVSYRAGTSIYTCQRSTEPANIDPL